METRAAIKWPYCHSQRVRDLLDQGLKYISACGVGS